MPEDKNGNKSTSKLNNFIKGGVKKFSDGLQNIANNMDHGKCSINLTVMHFHYSNGIICSSRRYRITSYKAPNKSSFQSAAENLNILRKKFWETW